MRKNLLSLATLALSLGYNAQVLTHVDATAKFYVGEDALVYSGGGVQTKADGLIDLHGNMMIVGTGTDVVKTITAANANKTDGGNIILRLNDATDYMNSTYGQLYIHGISQGNLTGIVNKELKTDNHGTYQQIAMPFFAKVLSELNSELKTFSTVRWSQNEILKWNNRNVRSDHFTSLATVIGSTAGEPAWRYYMLGTKNLNLASQVRVVKGRPVANGVSASMIDAGLGINFGATGNNKNVYNEFYYSYLQDNFEAANPWTGTFGKNIYQFGNPYFTNLDLSKIGLSGNGVDGATVGDGNALNDIVGIRYSPGTVVSNSQGATTSNNNAKYTTFANGVPAGDVGMIIKPLGTFVIKFKNNPTTAQTLNFDGLRRFKGESVRAAGTNYSVTASRSAVGKESNTVKQLGVIGLDANGKEIARTYYVVYPNAVTGHPTSISTQVTSTSSNILGTYEEEPTLGGYDNNYTSKYWLYINEANEVDFAGKPIPMVLYGTNIKSLKFEVRENSELVHDGTHLLSSGVGFFYQPKGGEVQEVSQYNTVDVNGVTEFNLYYGNAINNTKAAPKATTSAPSRTKVAYDPNIDNYIALFDPNWKTANINVYDMSGKLVLTENNINTESPYVINLSKEVKASYVVVLISDKGEKVNSKIIR